MALILKRLFNVYHYINEEIADPRTNKWFLIASPWPGLFLLGSYLYFVFNLGPRLMKNRKPFQLDKVLIVYNIFQILVSIYIAYMGTVHTLFKYNIFCEPVDYSDAPDALRIASVAYLYFSIKIVDLLDTVFFVLRKKNNQVTFLHVYHHTGMVMLGWGGTKYFAGGQSVFIGTINSFVHIVMYTYYLLTSCNAEYKKSVWWKKHITQLQIIQFILLIWHNSQLLWVEPCGYPAWTAAVLVPQDVFMLVLFVDFYIKTYVKSKKNSIDSKNELNNEIKPKSA